MSHLHAILIEESGLCDLKPLGISLLLDIKYCAVDVYSIDTRGWYLKDIIKTHPMSKGTRNWIYGAYIIPHDLQVGNIIRVNISQS